MSPLRAYRCTAGHVTELVESMDGPTLGRCPQQTVKGTCLKPVAPIIQPTQRPIVKNGTPTYHKSRP